MHINLNFIGSVHQIILIIHFWIKCLCLFIFKMLWLLLPCIKVCAVLCLVVQSCPSLCNPMDYSLPDYSGHGISQANSWSGLPFPSPGNLPDPGIETASSMSPALQVDSLPTEPSRKPDHI